VLLDRKRVKFWQRIIFGLMALLMAGFGIAGVLGAFPGCGGGGPAPITDRIEQLEAKLQASPGAATTLRSLAEAYQQLGAQQPQGSEAQIAAWQTAADSYQRYIEALGDPADDAGTTQKLVDTYIILASLYTQLGDAEALVRVYGQLTDLQPNNAENYLYYGQAAQNAGRTDLAVLSYRKYLELEPDSQFAADVRALLEELTGEPEPSPSATDGG